jgi:hypothetical protein
MHPDLASHDDTVDHVHEFAASLVESLGRDEAVWVCRSNSWDGVLRIIEPPMAHGLASKIAH